MKDEYMEENTDNQNLVAIEGNIPLTTSYIVAEQLGIEHRSMMQLIKDHQERIEKHFGHLRFQNANGSRPQGGGRAEQFCDLTENQAHYILTLSRNTEESMEVKARFVKAFAEAKELLTIALAPVEEFEAMLDALMQRDAKQFQSIDTRKLIVMVMYLQRMEELQGLPVGQPKSMEQRMQSAFNALRETEKEQQTKLLLAPKKSISTLSKESRKMIDALNQFDRPVSAREVANRFGWPEEATWKQLVRMVFKDEVGNTRKGYISLIPPDGGE